MPTAIDGIDEIDEITILVTTDGGDQCPWRSIAELVQPLLHGEADRDQ